jgi:tetratricopeptide (TPR) repeat protein
MNIERILALPIFCLFSVFFVIGAANSVYAGHPGEAKEYEHFVGDGHDHNDPDHVHALSSKASQLNDEGISLYRKKDYPAAAEKFKESLEYNPNLGEVYGMLGKTQVKLKKFEEAVINLTKSLELTKNDLVNRLTHKSLARAYIGIGKHEEARKEIDTYKEMCIAQDMLTPKTEKIISDLYGSLE